MRIDIGRYIDNEGDVRYSVETIKNNRLEILGDFDMYDKAIKHAKTMLTDKGDFIFNWDGTFWQFTGRGWKASHVKD